MTLSFEFDAREGESPNLEGTKGDILLESFVENAVFFLEVDDLLPVPLLLQKLLIVHVSSQGALLKAFKLDLVAIKSSQNWRRMV